MGYVVRPSHDNDDKYVFVSYTREQFDVNGRTKSPRNVERDRAKLIGFGRAAALAEGVPAFFIDFACLNTKLSHPANL